MKKQLDRIEAKLDEILRVENRLLKNTANVNGSKGLLQTIQAWYDSKNGVCLSERAELVYDGTQSIKPAQDMIINNLASEPDWSKAPEWAEWFQICKSGNGFWNEDEPVFNESFGEWVLQGSEHFQHAGVFDSKDYQNSLRRRPKSEQVNITASLNVDTDGYLAGKKSFISAYVDLLLARMAKEGRFSKDVLAVYALETIKIFDVVLVTNVEDDSNYFAIPTHKWMDNGCYFFNALRPRDDGALETEFWEGPFYVSDFIMRPITEPEAVEFRKAMEAVYG